DDRTSSAAALRWVSPLPRPPVRPCTRERSSSRTSSTGDQRGRAPLLARSGAPAARAREAPFVWAGRAHRAPRGPCADGCGVRRLLGVDRPGRLRSRSGSPGPRGPAGARGPSLPFARFFLFFCGASRVALVATAGFARKSWSERTLG
ncbi:unnamed protein product, partial [Prorocentrum cordatum]